MKKTIITLVLLASSNAFSMQLDVVTPKEALRNRLITATNQIKVEGRSMIPPFPELQAHANGLATLKAQIIVDIPHNEAQTLFALWDTALLNLRAMLSKPLQICPADVVIWITDNTNILNAHAIQYVGANKQSQARFKSFHSILCGLLEESKQKIRNYGVFLPALTHLTEILTNIGNRITSASTDLNQRINERDDLIMTIYNTPIQDAKTHHKLDLEKEEIRKSVLFYTRFINPTALMDELIIKLRTLHELFNNYATKQPAQKRELQITIDIYNECRRSIAKAAVLNNAIPLPETTLLIQEFDNLYADCYHIINRSYEV